MKSARQAEILKLIQQHDIGTQEELAARLKEIGYSVTQATVSRDIRELGLTKITGEDGHLRYSIVVSQQEPSVSNRFERVFRESFVAMDTAANMLVIHTVSGMAMAAAAVVDELDFEEIVGCIAGDNTIMCATRTPEDAEAAMRKMQEMLRGS